LFWGGKEDDLKRKSLRGGPKRFNAGGMGRLGRGVEFKTYTGKKKWDKDAKVRRAVAKDRYHQDPPDKPKLHIEKQQHAERKLRKRKKPQDNDETKHLYKC